MKPNAEPPRSSWSFFRAVRQLKPAAVCLVLLIFCSGAAGLARAAGLEFYVATNGNDGWSGKLPAPKDNRGDGPFATLERARDAIRESRAANPGPGRAASVWIRGGLYFRARTFELAGADGGNAGGRVIYRAWRDEVPRLIGGIEPRGWTAVTNPAILSRVDATARPHLLQVDLRGQGILDFGMMERRGFGPSVASGPLELMFEDRPMTLARWPNHDWARIAKTPAGQHGGKFSYDGERPRRWALAEDIWVHGYWTYDWADTYEKIHAIDLERREISTEPPHGAYGYTPGKRYYALNLLEELDEPGEWYLDRKTGVLYFWPPGPIEKGRPMVSTLATPLLSLSDASFVTIRGLTFECARASGVTVAGGESNLIAGCVFRNLGTFAASIGDERKAGAIHQHPMGSGVVACDIYEMGEGGIQLAGGDRMTLEPGGNFADNNDIHHYSRCAYTYRPAVLVDGVGQRVAHNRLHDAPHNAILWGGNDHLFEYNEVYQVCLETGDAGAFYTGRNLTTRGTMIRYNRFRDISRALEAKGGFVDVMSVYLDDCACGTTLFGNIFQRAGRAAMIGGGRDNIIENNIFVDCNPAIHVDGRGEGWMRAEFFAPEGTIMTGLKAVPYYRPPYSDRYPHLANVLEDQPGLPKYNQILRNICVGPKWIEWLDGLNESKVEVRDNITKGDPGFVDAARGDFRLKEGSPGLKLGFKPIPAERIGLVKDDYRRGLPQEDDQIQR